MWIFRIPTRYIFVASQKTVGIFISLFINNNLVGTADRVCNFNKKYSTNSFMLFTLLCNVLYFVIFSTYLLVPVYFLLNQNAYDFSNFKYNVQIVNFKTIERKIVGCWKQRPFRIEETSPRPAITKIVWTCF